MAECLNCCVDLTRLTNTSQPVITCSAGHAQLCYDCMVKWRDCCLQRGHTVTCPLCRADLTVAVTRLPTQADSQVDQMITLLIPELPPTRYIMTSSREAGNRQANCLDFSPLYPAAIKSLIDSRQLNLPGNSADQTAALYQALDIVRLSKRDRKSHIRR